MVLIVNYADENVYMLSYKLRETPKVINLEKCLIDRRTRMIEDCYSNIDKDYSLIRYLCKETEYKDIISNKDGYITLKRDDNTTTTIGRFILEYYAQLDCKLYTVINNEDYEINHINKNVNDNRLVNLEIVTKLGNRLHKENKLYDQEIIMTSMELQEIQKRNMKDKQHEIDKALLKRKSGLFHKAIKEEKINPDILKYSYLEFKYVKKVCRKQEHTHTENSRNNRKNTDTDRNICREIFLSGEYTNYLNKLVNFHKEYIYNTIIDNNIKLLNRHQIRYPYLDKIVSQFRISDTSKKQYKTLVEKEWNSRNLLCDLFEFLRDTKEYTINDNNVLATITISWMFTAYGKYNAFKVAYLLGLLNRQKPLERKLHLRQKFVKCMENGQVVEKSILEDVHFPSFISIPIYTEDLLKEANKRAKILVDLNIRSITYFTIREAFGEEIADSVYRNPKVKRNYEKYGLPVKKDFISFLQIDLYFNSDIQLRGFLDVEEIVEALRWKNEQRRNSGQFVCNMYKGFDKFIKRLLNYDREVKEEMERLRF